MLCLPRVPSFRIFLPKFWTSFSSPHPSPIILSSQCVVRSSNYDASCYRDSSCHLLPPVP
jgi:hypothetical protein